MNQKSSTMEKMPDEHHVCPVWMAYLFDNPVRSLIHRPAKLFREWVKPGMKTLDLGCGLGHFSLGLARLVGESGRVYAVDVQSGMLSRMIQRANRAGLGDRITAVSCGCSDLGGVVGVDFALSFWMLHETPDYRKTLRMLHDCLRDGGVCYVAEPGMHVSGAEFMRSLEAAEAAGFRVLSQPVVRMSHAVVLQKVKS